MVSVLFKLIEELLGQGIESVGERATLRWWRYALFVLAFITSIGGTVASLWFWQSPAYPNIQGLIAYVQAGGPAWVLVTSGMLALTAIILAIPVAGRLFFAMCTAIAGTILTGFTLNTFQAHSVGIGDPVTLASFFGLLGLSLCTLLLAINDHPPLESPLAHFAIAYAQRLNHLRALSRFAQRMGWSVQGPEGRENTLTIEGPVDATHSAFITSRFHVEIGNSQSSNVNLRIVLTSPFDIPGFYCGFNKLDNLQTHGMLGMEITGLHQRPLYFYVQPYPEFPISNDMLYQIREYVNTRRGLLPNDAMVQATPLGMRIYIARTYRRLTAKDGDPTAAIQWLRGLMALLEPVSPRLADFEIAARTQRYKK
jgi:hypothetical protein